MTEHFFESIAIRNGCLLNLALHQERMERTVLDKFKVKTEISLQDRILLPTETKVGLWKCRVSYSTEIHEIRFEVYEMRHPRRVLLLEDPTFEYHYKSENRQHFAQILANNPQIDDCIFTKNGLLTDSSYANLAFYDGNHWFTTRQVLLEGTKRKCLLQKQVIHETDISLMNLRFFQRIAFLNAMRGLSTSYAFHLQNDYIVIDP